MATVNALNIPTTDKPRVVVVGGGFAGLYLTSHLNTDAYQVVLLDRQNFHTFIPLLYQVATAGLEAPSIVGPLRKTFRGKKDFHFRMLGVESIQPERQIVETAAGKLEYDHLYIATGTRTNFFNNENLRRYTLPLKTLSDARQLRNHLFQTLEKLDLTASEEERRALLTFVVAGGGPTGVEMAGALAELRDHVLKRDYPDSDVKAMRIILVEGGDRLLAAFSEKSGADARAALEKMGVELRFNTLIADYNGHEVSFKEGEPLTAATLIWGAGVRGDLIEGLPEAAIEKSQYVVDDQLRIRGCENIYALGDIARLTNEEYPHGHPGVAQVAIQMGKTAARNLNALAKGKKTEAFSYFDKGNLATIGRNRAVADLPGGWHFRGAIAWFVWAFVHLFYLIGFRNRFVTLYSWIVNYFTYNRAIRLVMEPDLAEELKKERQEEQA